LIEGVIQSEGFKTVRRCPECGTTGIKERKTKAPRWRCNNKHEFFEPTETEEPVTKYEASFGDTYSGIERAIETQTIKSIALRPSDQLSMEELDLAKLEELLSHEPEVLTKIRKALISQNLSLEDLDAQETTDFVPSMTDQRNTVIRSIKERRGQAKFRKALITRYGPRCVVTDCGIQELLEAAHITPYRGEAYNDPSNGLLLRADIHTLFDLNLMWVEPDTYSKRCFSP
jgi:putative restriction endonuclease